MKLFAFVCCSATRTFFCHGGGALSWNSILFRSISSFAVRNHRTQIAFRKRDGERRRTARRSTPSAMLSPSIVRQPCAANSKSLAVTQ
jgi:hypothetical protein